jgi:hypothetical protein
MDKAAGQLGSRAERSGMESWGPFQRRKAMTTNPAADRYSKELSISVRQPQLDLAWEMIFVRRARAAHSRAMDKYTYCIWNPRKYIFLSLYYILLCIARKTGKIL